MLEWLTRVTIGEVILAYLACALLHEVMIVFLPDRIAGPGGWLIDTSYPQD